MVAKKLHSGNSFFFDNGAWFELYLNPTFERIETPFTIDRRVDPIPPTRSRPSWAFSAPQRSWTFRLRSS